MSFLDTLLGRKHPPMIGLDISSSSVKLVELGQSGSGEFVLERFGFPYTTLHNGDIRPGNLRDRFDVILIPSISEGTLRNGFARDASATPKMLLFAGSASMPNSRSGEERWKRLSACDCVTCASPKMRRSLSAVGGILTASRESQALAEAIRWLTGQMPQIRAISDGIS